jgi:hypothetical protein
MTDASRPKEESMRSKKRYTNATFTKRVDHEGGRHRILRAAAEPAVCESCGLVWADRHWSARRSTEPDTDHPHFRPARPAECPACRQKREGIPGGILHLDGAYLTRHLAEVENLLRNEGARSERSNPLSRILGREWGDGTGLTVTTTTDQLAARLGRALRHAFGGDVRFLFSHENKLTRVHWHRD